MNATIATAGCSSPEHQSLQLFALPRTMPLERILRESLDAALVGCRKVYSTPYLTIAYPPYLPLRVAVDVVVKVVDEAYQCPEAMQKWPPRELCCSSSNCQLPEQESGLADCLCDWYNMQRKNKILDILNQVTEEVTRAESKSVFVNTNNNKSDYGEMNDTRQSMLCRAVISKAFEEKEVSLEDRCAFVVVLPPSALAVLNESLDRLRSMRGISSLYPKMQVVEAPESHRKRKRVLSPPPPRSELSKVGLQLLVDEVQDELQAEKRACSGLLERVVRARGGGKKNIVLPSRPLRGHNTVASDDAQDVHCRGQDTGADDGYDIEPDRMMTLTLKRKFQKLRVAMREERHALQSVWGKLYGAAASVIGLK